MPNEIDNAAPIASALVIGIGGSGVQTLARLRAAVRDRDRPGQVAIDNVKFLAIDAVEQNAQIPPLPPGTGLSKDEFYNIARDAVNAHDYVRTAWQHDRVLQETWDVDYRAPNVPLTEGMKRSRPLGNLVFRIQTSQVERAIRTSLNQVLAIDPEQWRSGSDGGKAKVPVFIVGSSAGGTGSSGFLHVMHAVHRAAIAAGVSAEIYPVIFLPDVFARARQKSLDSAAETRGHWANAYAFLAELDYIVSEPLAFDDLLCPPHEMRTEVETLDVVKSAFLIDGRLTDGGQFDEKDAFDIAATGVHSLLVTDIRTLIGAEGVNNDFLHYDDDGARTVYAGLGALRVVYPGSTYRRYLRARLRAYLLQEYLLDDSANEATRGGPVRDELVGRLLGLRDRFTDDARQLKSVRRMEQRAADAELEAGDSDRAEDVGEHLNAIYADADAAGRELQSTLPGLVRAARSQIDGIVDQIIIESGEGLAALRFAVKKAKEQLTTHREAEDTRAGGLRASVNGLRQPTDPGSLSECAERVRRAHERIFFLRGGEAKKAVKAYSEATERFTNSVLSSHVADAQLDVLKTAIDHLSELEFALTAATKVLREERDDADEAWRDDAFEGKDAGGLHVMGVVPSDVQSTDTRTAEVEDSRIASAAWERLARMIADETPDLKKPGLGDEVRGTSWLKHVYKEWWRLGKSHGIRGLVALGQGDTDARAQVESYGLLQKVLGQQTEELARLAQLLPASLEGAAALADAAATADVYEIRNLADFAGEETQQLDTLLRETLRKASYVTVQVDPAKIRMQDDAPLAPPVKTVGASGEMLTRIAEMVPDARVYDSGDPEQVKTVTLQMHLPLVGVEGLDQWHRNYQRVLASRRAKGQKANDPPPHLDVKFAAVVTRHPLVMRNYADVVIAEFVVQASSLLLLSREAPTLVSGYGDVAAIKTEYDDNDEVVAFGYPLRIVDDKARPSGDRLRLGSTAADVFDATGRSPKFQTGTNEVFDYILERAKYEARSGRAELLEALKKAVTTYRDSNHLRAEQLPRESPSEEVIRESQVRLAIDRAAAILLAEIDEALPDLRPPVI